MTRFAPRTTTSFSLFVLILKSMILKQAFPLKFRVWNEILWKKELDYEANFFLQNEILKWHFFKISDCELRIFRSARFRIQNISNNHILEMKYFSETQFLNSIFIEKSGFDEEFTSEKKRFDSICSADNNKFFTLRAHFKRHDFVANSFIENQRLKWNFPKKTIRFWSKRFPVQWKFEKNNFQNVRFLIECFSFRQISKTNLFE